MREGYSNALAALLEGAKAIARPVIEILETVVSDIKNTRTEFQEADGGNPATDTDPPGFRVFDQGGCRLLGVETELASSVGVDGTPVSMDNDPASGVMGVANINWTGGGGTELESATLRLSNGTGLNAAEFYYAQIYRVATTGNFLPGGIIEWTLEPLSLRVRRDAGIGTQDYLFTFADGVVQIPIGAPPILRDGSNITTEPLNPANPTTVLVAWGVKADGSPAPNAEWQASSVNDFSGAGFRATRLLLTRFGGTFDFEPFAPNSPIGVPFFQMTGRTYTAQTITWSTFPVDLGQAPGALTDLQCTVSKSDPGGTSVVTEITDTVQPFTAFVDGDVIGVDNTPDGGADLSALLRQQTYQVRGILTPSVDALVSPRLMRIGVSEVTTETIFDQIEIESFETQADPLSSQAEVPTASIRIRRDGVKDYRSFGEELLSGRPYALLTFRMWLGHPTLPKSDWLHIEDFVARNYDPGGADGLALDLISPLLYMLEEVPQLINQARAPIVYTADTIELVWADLFDQLAVRASLIGGGPTDQNLVTRTISELTPGVDLLQEISFIAGGVTTSSQGIFQFKPLFNAGGSVATILRPDYELAGYDVGTDRRSTQVDIFYGYDGSAFTAESTYVASDAILEAFGVLGGGEPQAINGDVSKWLPTITLPDIIGPRLVDAFATGVSQMRIRCRTPRPYLEIGDQISVQQDRFVGYDPVAKGPLRGEVSLLARVVGVHDIFGRDLTLWVPSLLTVIVAFEDGGVTTLGRARVITVTPGAAFRPADANPHQFADWILADGAISVEARTGIPAQQEQRAVLPLPVIAGGGWLAEMVVIAEGNDAAGDFGWLDFVVWEIPLNGDPPVNLHTFPRVDGSGRQTRIWLAEFYSEPDAVYEVEVIAKPGNADPVFVYAVAFTRLI